MADQEFIFAGLGSKGPLWKYDTLAAYLVKWNNETTRNPKITVNVFADYFE